MVLFFPDIATLRRALGADGINSHDGPAQPARARVEDDGALWIEPARPLAKAALAELKKRGVVVKAACPASLNEEISCWHQLVPAEREPITDAPGVRCLFHAAGPRVPALIGEMQRLGRRPCGLRWLDDGSVFLLVNEPPLFSLLRAGAREGNEIHAYRERRSGLWVEVGHGHPLADQLELSARHMLLIRSPRMWTFHEEGPFEEIDAAGVFTIPSHASSLCESEVEERVSVSPRLARSDSVDPAELWVLGESGHDQLRALIEQVDDRILSRLTFAVTSNGGEEVVVLRRQAGLRSLPVLVLEGVAFAAHARLPNLYVPCGARIQPRLRRDAVRQLFAGDTRLVTWLAPAADGGFTPHSLPESSFRALESWIEYKAPPATSLAPLQRSAAFELRAFAVEEDDGARRSRQEPADRSRKPAAPLARPAATHETPRPSTQTGDLIEDTPEPGAENEIVEVRGDDERQQRLAELQKAFLELDAPLDAPARQALWREMARLHAALGHAGDASLAWAYALWEEESPADVEAWRQAEASTDLDEATPSAHGLRALVAGVVHSASTKQAVAPDQLRAWQQTIDKHEEALPVRLAWLARFALFRLSGNDVLALARARDRVLERLFRHGLRLELDLPGFLRFGGNIGQERLIAVREHLARLHQDIRKWLHDWPRCPFTPLYADLTFAHGLARLGATVEAERLLTETAQLRDEDALHAWLHDVYALRVRQVARGETTAGSALPAALLARLDGLPNDLRYKGDRLRQFSRIVEPEANVDPIYRWHEHYPGAIERELVGLSGLSNPDELWARLGGLLQDKQGKFRPYRGVILARALELAPRVGEEFARQALARVLPTLDDLTDSLEAQILIVEKGLFLAAHYDQGPHVLGIVERFQQMLTSGRASIQALEPLLEQLFQGLRKFGMRELVGQLLEQLTTLFLSGQNLKQLRLRLGKQAGGGMLRQELSAWKALLHVAGGWLYFGQETRAVPILDETRNFLFMGVLHPLEQTQLACAYIRALGQLDVEPAMQRCLELFHKIERIDAVFTTDSHVSLAQLSLIEAAVLTLASEEFSLDPRGRHWLEDDEFQVRSRIHRDLRRVMEQDA